MTILIIPDGDTFKENFLQRIIDLHFPSGGAHQWNADAFVDMFFGYDFNNPSAVVTLTAPGGTAMITPAGLSDPKGIVSSFSSTGPGVVQSGTGHLQVAKDVFSTNPQVSVSASLTIAFGSVPTGHNTGAAVGTATGVTSGRPGGDAEKTAGTATVTLDGNRILGPFANATVTGSASAGSATPSNPSGVAAAVGITTS